MIKLTQLTRLEQLARRGGDKGMVAIKASDLLALTEAASTAIELKVAITKARKDLERSANPFDNACSILLEADAASEPYQDSKSKKLKWYIK